MTALPEHSSPDSGKSLFLVPGGRYRRPRPQPLVLWHLLSLDAPSVAALWVIFIAWMAGVHLSPVVPAAMFLAVWMLYAADRLLDARPLFQEAVIPDLQERHHFHHRHRRAFLTAIVAACLPLCFLLHHTEPVILHGEVLLACLLLAWLLLVHTQPASPLAAHRLPKELAVGVFFPSAVFLPTATREITLLPWLLIPAAGFAALCTLNCLFLHTWEHPLEGRMAHATTRWGVRHLHLLSWSLAVGADAGALLLLVFRCPLPHAAAALTATCASCLFLLLMNRCRNRWNGSTVRALADLVLLTPLPVMVVCHFLPR